MGGMSSRDRRTRSCTLARLALAGIVWGLAGCELEEITIADVENVVIAEIYLDVAANRSDNVARAFLHRTVGISDVESLPPLTDAIVTMTRSNGFSFPLVPESTDDCLESSPIEEPGACFVAESAAAFIGPGEVVEVLVELPGGGEIRGATRVPGGFELVDIPDVCSLRPDALMTVKWSSADDAWAYLSETSIRGLPDALRPEGIIVRDDPLYLLGLSVSDSDTTVVFPSEFGIFNRFDLDVDLAVRLQRGLPDGSTAEISITALDRNAVNWSRGGTFNPSGQVRVPSLSGDGTGVFASTVSRGFDVLVTDRSSGLPACPLD